jgi:YbgC/YbaW family acyl-CoA thioester hydrolase
VVVGLIEGLERFARPAGALLAVAAGTLLVIDVMGVFGAGEAGVQPEQLLTIDDPLTTIVQWFAVLALGAMVLGISRSHREAAPVIGTLIALAGSTGASVGAAGIWVSARLSGAVPPSGIAPIAQAFLTGTLIVFAVLAIVLARSAAKDEPILRGVYLSVVRARNGLLPVLVAVPSVTGAVLAMTVAGLRLDGSAPTEFVWIAAIAATVGGIATAVALGRLGLSAPAAVAGLAVVAGWLAPLTGFFTFTGVAVTVTMALPLALVLTRVAGAVGDREKRRTLAVPWDVGSYFARRFHPFAPPTYHDRAVADLDAVIDRFRDRGVVVGAHSQGTVVVTSALSRAIPDTGGVGLLTYGSPLASLYARFFPRYFTDEYFEAIAGRVPAVGSTCGAPPTRSPGRCRPGPTIGRSTTSGCGATPPTGATTSPSSPGRGMTSPHASQDDGTGSHSPDDRRSPVDARHRPPLPFHAMDYPAPYHRKVRFSDSDAQAIVFNANYLTYIDDAISDYFDALEVDWNGMNERGYDMVLGRAELDFRSSGRKGETLVTGVRVASIGTSSVVFEITIWEEGRNGSWWRVARSR